MNNSSINASTPSTLSQQADIVGGNVEVTAEKIVLSNHSRIDTHILSVQGGSAGNITFNIGTFSATDSAIEAGADGNGVGAGSVTIQGGHGSRTSAHSVSLTNTTYQPSTADFPVALRLLRLKEGPSLSGPTTSR